MKCGGRISCKLSWGPLLNNLALAHDYSGFTGHDVIQTVCNLHATAFRHQSGFQ